MAKEKPGKIQIAVYDKPTKTYIDQEVDAVLSASGVLAIHISPFTGKWVVTHVASGARMVTAANKKTALEVMRALAPAEPGIAAYTRQTPLLDKATSAIIFAALKPFKDTGKAFI